MRLVGVEHFEPAGIVLGAVRFAAHQVQRRPAFAAGLGEDQRAGGEVKRRQPDLARRLGPLRLPVQSARDHQVQHEKQVRLQREDDPLAEPPQAAMTFRPSRR